MDLRIVTPDTDELWDAYLECRYQNLYASFNLPRTCTTSELDHPRTREGILHRAVVDESSGALRVAASGRLDLQPAHPLGPSAQLRYCAVDTPYRGSGAGQMLVGHLEDQARRAGCKRLWMEARNVALNFYLRMGYHDIGEGPTKWDVIPHRLLARDL